MPIKFHWFTLTTQIHNYNTRSKFIIRDQLINTKNLFIHTANYGLKKIKIQGAKIWNELPSDIRVITSFGLFNLRLKRYMVYNYNPNTLGLIIIIIIR